MHRYNHSKIEKKWQNVWEKKKLYRAADKVKKKKFYALVEFPYPSGDGLHVGHVRSYTAMDIVARKRRMEGFNVLYPIGWDAFGLPTENYAIKHKIHPKVVTKRNTDTFRRQLKALGFSFDWEREINTSEPTYYKWTQWIFLKLFEAGLAYKAKTLINWCTNCKIGLANEEVVAGHCERCSGVVEKREKEQWMLKITMYAEKLLKGLETVSYIPEARVQQEHWIGRSEGALLKFEIRSTKSETNSKLQIQNSKQFVEVFTTRPDTLFGATYMVLSPEHNLISDLKFQISNWKEVEDYIAATKKKTDIERTADIIEKTGVELTGVKAINPATKEEIPIWISDYVLAGYGTGAIMAVPAHDERDYEFARKFGLPIRKVIKPVIQQLVRNAEDIAAGAQTSLVLESECWEGEGEIINSNGFNGMSSEKVRREITEFVGGKITTTYKLRDWVFSRQRYWGEPIPLIFCESCRETGCRAKANKGEMLNPGWFAVQEKDLPVLLPNVKNYTPTDTGESPLAKIASWVNVKCPRCGGKAQRETDVMPNWAGSSWYFLRYADPKNKKEFAGKKHLKQWTPVDWYNGGMEHTVLHLLYSRFWNQFLYDQKLVPTREPYKKRTSHGLILGEGGIKMSKSKGNVINPDMLVKASGADALRLYEMFIGPFNQAVAWDPRGITGTKRFLERVWVIAHEKEFTKSSDDAELTRLLNHTIKKVGEDIEAMTFNTAVSTLMIFSNACAERGSISRAAWEKFLMVLAPFAPHMVDELWAKLGNTASIHRALWPKFDPKLIQADTFQLVVQVNGKVRDTLEASQGISQKEAEELAQKSERVRTHLGEGTAKKIIFVPNRLINIVV